MYQGYNTCFATYMYIHHTQKSMVSEHRECRRKAYLMVLIVSHCTIYPSAGIVHLSTCNAISVHIRNTLVMMPPTLCIITYMVHTIMLNTTMVMYITQYSIIQKLKVGCGFCSPPPLPSVIPHKWTGPFQSFKTCPLCKTS